MSSKSSTRKSTSLRLWSNCSLAEGGTERDQAPHPVLSAQPADRFAIQSQRTPSFDISSPPDAALT